MGFLKICGMILCLAAVKYRERIGDQLGEPEWMKYFGGVYNFVIIVSTFMFFWFIASLTGTQKIFFYPLYVILGGAFQ